MIHRRGLPAGLTLVELLVGLAVVGAIAASLPLLVDGALGLREREDVELRREREVAALAEAWAHDAAAAHAADTAVDGCTLHLAGGDIRYRADVGNVWRETRATGLTAWTPAPMRPLARLQTGEAIAFTAGARTLTLDVTTPDGPWSRTVALRRSAP